MSSEQKFVYDGYKQIAEYDEVNDQFARFYTWQPDSVAQDVPLWVKDGSSYYFYMADGNKNIRAMTDAGGNVVAEYDYGPFGRTLAQSGTYAASNPYRFSSEYHDDETGLVYYNYRYYSPALGRWLSRDPIGEEGGYGLYVFVDNAPNNSWDLLGNSKQDSTNPNKLTKEQSDKLKDILSKNVFKWYENDSEAGGAWSLENGQYFAYDGYLQVAGFDSSWHDIQKTYYWSDSNTLEWQKDHSGNKYHFSMYDGNKNIVGTVDDTQTLTSSYEYNPFGRILTKSGTYADSNKFRFSSEYHDDETSLVYYNYRYYTPTLGRWLSRDPLGEDGGYNLYGFVENNSLNSLDLLGKLNVANFLLLTGHKLSFPWYGNDNEIFMMGYSSYNKGVDYKDLRLISDWYKMNHVFSVKFGTYAEMVSNDEIIKQYNKNNPKSIFPSLVPNAPNMIGLHRMVKNKFEVECWINNNDNKVSLPGDPDGISLKLLYGFKAWIQKGGSFKYMKGEEDIINHEMGHSDYIWGELVLPLYSLIKEYNYFKINKGPMRTIREIGGVTIDFSKLKCCKDFKAFLEQNIPVMEDVVSHFNKQHKDWNIYGHGTSKVLK